MEENALDWMKDILGRGGSNADEAAGLFESDSEFRQLFTEIYSERPSAQQPMSTKSDFEMWMENTGTRQPDGTFKTTLPQQVELAKTLYNQAEGQSDETPAADIIAKFENATYDTRTLVCWKGISVEWFLDVFCKSKFVLLLAKYGCELWFVRKVCIIEMLRRHGVQSGALIESVHVLQKTTTSDEKHVGGKKTKKRDELSLTKTATTFLSYTGRYKLSFFIEILEKLKGEYLWMDLFCVNQFAWTGQGRAQKMVEFRDTLVNDLQAQIRTINSTVLLLEKWNDAFATVGQLWVLWEVFNSVEAKAKFAVLLPESETNLFLDAVGSGNQDFHDIMASLASIDCNRAKAADDNDRNSILTRMKREKEGLPRVSQVVSAKMRGWLAETALTYYRSIAGQGIDQGLACQYLNNTAILFEDLGRLSEAEALHKEALAGREQAFGQEHDFTFESVNNLGTTLMAQGKFEEAMPLYEDAYERSLRLNGEDDPRTLMALDNLALLRQECGHLRDASSLSKQVLQARRQLLGDAASDTMKSVKTQANIQLRMGNLDTAERLYQEALEGQVRLRGADHPETLSIMSNLAVVMQERGQLSECIAMGETVVAKRRRVLGDLHPDTLESIDNLGNFKSDQGCFDEAEKLYGESLAGRRSVLGDNSIETIRSIEHLGVLCYRQGKLDEALLHCSEAIQGFRKLLGILHPDTLTAYDNLAGVYQDKGNYTHAETFYKAALLGRKQVLGENHYDTLSTVHNIGLLRMEQQMYPEAEGSFREDFAGCLRLLGVRHPRTAKAVRCLSWAQSMQR